MSVVVAAILAKRLSSIAEVATACKDAVISSALKAVPSARFNNRSTVGPKPISSARDFVSSNVILPRPAARPASVHIVEMLSIVAFKASGPSMFSRLNSAVGMPSARCVLVGLGAPAVFPVNVWNSNTSSGEASRKIV